MASERVKKRTLRDSSEVVMWMRCVSWKKVANRKSSKVSQVYTFWITSHIVSSAGFGYFVVMSCIEVWVCHNVIKTEVRHWRHQFESNISGKSFSLSNFSCTKRLQTMWGVDCGLGQQNKIVMCFTRGAIVPHWWHKKRHRARGALIYNFLRVRQIGPICRTSKKSQIVSVKCDVSFDFFI
jgi:hypothetical protein